MTNVIWPGSAPLPILVELLFGSTWTDITQYVYQRDQIVITGGKQDEGSTMQPATASLTLNNQDGRFSPGTTLWGTPLTRNMQLRISIQGVQSTTGNVYSGYRFWGAVPDWPPLWDPSGTDIYCQIVASGPLRQINQGGGEGSALTRYYNQLTGQFAPIAYWPCEEDPDSSVLGAGIDGGTTMSVVSGTPKWKAISNFNGSAPIAIVNKSSWDGLTGSVVYSGDDFYPSAGTYTWVCPPGVTTVDAIAVGGGAGGGAGGTAGGGGGEYAEEAALVVVPGNSYSIVVGAGGSGATAPNASGAGGNTTIAGSAKTVTAHGAPSVPYVTNGPGTGGTGSANTIHNNGGSGAAAQSSGTQVVKTYSSSGTWTCPAGVTSVQVECWGAGAGGDGGGKAGGANSGGFGGGGGAYSKLTSYAVTPGSVYSFTIGKGGSGGAANNNGTDGGDTHWVSTGTCLAKGGDHAVSGAGQGGQASSGVGNTKFSGGNGGTASQSGGSGGGGSAGSGGAGGTAVNNTTSSGTAGGAAGSGGGAKGGSGGNFNSNGKSGSSPGAGGGGGGGDASAGSGGSGSNGQVKLTYTSTSFSGGGGGASGGSAAAGTTATGQPGAVAVAGGGNGGDGGTSASDNGNSPTSPPGGGGGGVAAQANSGVTGGNGADGSAEMIYTPPAVPTNNVVRFILLVPDHGGNDGAVILRFYTGSTVIDHCDVTYAKGGKLRLQGFNSSNVQQFDSTAQAWDLDGQPVMISCELVNSGTSIAWTFKAVTPGSSSLLGSATGTVATASISNVTEVKVSPNSDITNTAIGHISVQYALINLIDVSDALNGHHTEHTTDRFIRLCTEQALDNAVEYNETADHWGFETGIQSWTGASNCTISQSSYSDGGVDDVWPIDGTHSLAILPATNAAFYAESPTGTSGQPVNDGDVVSAAAEITGNSGSASILGPYIAIEWFTSAGTSISVTTSAVGSSASAGTNQTLKVTGTAPATAAFFAIRAGGSGWGGSANSLMLDNVRVTPRMGPQTRKHYKKFLEEIEDLDAGLLKEAKTLYGLGYRTRIRMINQTPAVTIDYSLGQLWDQLAPVVDDRATKNDITVHRHKGSKVHVTLDDGVMSVKDPKNGGVGRYKHHRRVVAEVDEQLLALASHLLNLGTASGERYPTVSVNLARPEVASLMSALAAVDIGDYMQIINMPFWAPSPEVDQLVIGYTETLNAFTWEIVWNCTAESPYEITANSIRRW